MQITTTTASRRSTNTLYANLILLVMLIVATTYQSMSPGQVHASQGMTATVLGSVRDTITQQGIIGATVHIGTLSIRTEANGAIPLTAVPISTAVEAVTVEVTAPGYGLWRYVGVELSNDHPVEIRVTLGAEPQIVQPREPIGVAAAPFDGPPDYINVGRTFSTSCVYPPTNVQRVDRVPFIDYVRNVLPNEWALSWKDKPAALEAGAVAASQFAWSTAFVQRKWTRNGYAFDVLDSVCDQVYKDRSATIDYSPTDNAVARMWGVALIRDNKLITTFFRDRDESCVRSNSNDCMGQWGSYYRAQEGMSALQILHYYYDPVVDIRTAPSNRGLAVKRSPDIAVKSGETGTLSICMRNTGTTPWKQNSTNLVVVDPVNSQNTSYASPFANNTWRSATTPTTLTQASAALGQNGSWSFTVTAPSNLAPGTYQMAVQPRHSDGTTVPTDTPIVWNVTVLANAGKNTHRTLLPLIANTTPRIIVSCQ